MSATLKGAGDAIKGWWQKPSVLKQKFADTREWWQQPSVTTQFKSAAASIETTSNKAAAIFDRIQGLFPSLSDKETSVLESLSSIPTKGISSAAVHGVRYLLKHAETTPDVPADILKADETSTLAETWKKLDAFHILFRGLEINPKKFGEKQLAETRKEVDGQEEGETPFLLLDQCQSEFAELRKKHHLEEIAPQENVPNLANSLSLSSLNPPSQAFDPELPALEIKTNEQVSAFSKKTATFATLYAVDNFLGTPDPNEYNRLLQNQDAVHVEQAYLNKFGKVRRFFHRTIYKLLSSIISPLIEKTLEKLVSHIRDFLKNQLDLLHFAEEKIGDLSDYFGLMESGRQLFLGTPNLETGTFERYLQQNVNQYAGRFTEAELLRITGDYIVQNFIPRPQFTIGTYRIPVISTLFEWIGFSIRKALVRRFLNQTDIINRILTQGTASVHHAQYGIKRVLYEKLKQVNAMVERTRVRKVQPNPTHPSNMSAELKAKKAAVITRTFHLAVRQLSENMLRFIAIESCNGDRRKLADLDNAVSIVVQDLIRTFSHLLKAEPVSMQTTLEDAATDMFEMTLVSIFDEKDSQIEHQLQRIFSLMDNAYVYASPEERVRQENHYRIKCEELDKNLKILIEQLSRNSVGNALEENLKNLSGEKHRRIQAFVEKEKQTMIAFSHALLKRNADLQNLRNPDEIRVFLNQTMFEIERYLSHLSTVLESAAFKECYSDVIGDLHNIYALHIGYLSQYRSTIDQLLTQVDRLEHLHIEKAACEAIFSRLSGYLPGKEVEYEAILDHTVFPERVRSDLQAECNKIRALFGQNRALAEKIERVRQKTLREEDIQGIQARIDILTRAKDQLNRLTTITREPELYAGEIQDLRNSISVANPAANGCLEPLIRVQDTRELHQLLHGTLLERASPMGSQLDTLIRTQRLRLRQYQAEVRTLTTELDPSESEQSLTQRRRDLLENIDKILQGIRKTLHLQVETCDQEIKENLKLFSQCSQETGIFKLFENVAKEFKVQGCVSIGELKLFNGIAPQLMQHIVPQVANSIRTLIDAFGKPFHYKQLVLRLVFSDIAKRYTQ